MKNLDALFADVQLPLDGLWATIAQEAGTRSLARVMFVAAEPGAGTTVVAAATAFGLARNLRTRVGLFEADVERPGLGRLIGMSSEPGLSDVLDGRSTLEEARRAVPECEGLTVVTAGAQRYARSGELASEQARAVLRMLGEERRFLIIDAPPLLERADSRLLFPQIDAAVLVLRARATRRNDARRALEILQEARVPVLGAVLNRYTSDLPFGLGFKASPLTRS
jgi:tyrosine-protein kinase Etk/Wzc